MAPPAPPARPPGMRPAWLVLVSAVDFMISTWCALWPLRHHISLFTSFRGIASLYSLPGSNLDLWALAALRAAVVAHVAAAVRKRRPRSARAAWAKAATRRLPYFWVPVSLLLAAKVAALIASDLGKPLGPPARDEVDEEAWVWVSACLGLCSVVAEALAAQRALQWRPPRRPRDPTGGDAQTPLLGSDEDEEDEEGEEGREGATIAGLIKLSLDDWPVLAVALSCGVVAALGQAYIPHFTGEIINVAAIDPDHAAFVLGIKKLLAAAATCAVFTGGRGGLFTICMARVNVRTRKKLLAALLSQEIGFFDTTKTGDITSRLSADTTTMSDQIALNINVFLRSTVQAILVLGFMFYASWRLTLVTFTMVPVTVAISKVYGVYYRRLVKETQKELAAANGVAEEAVSSMTTVRAFAAEHAASSEYGDKLADYYVLQKKEAAAYALYAVLTTFLPNAITVVVLLYGGSLVLHKKLDAGALVSFMLYQQSLTSAFATIGDVFSGLTAAVGAADKVFELMHREPKERPAGGLEPAACEGRIEIRGVTFKYPARPDVPVLQNLSVSIRPGEVVALVGPSGGGKSSCVNLVERFYEPETGQVLLDGRDIACYSPRWLKRQVAIVGQEPVLYGRSVRRNIVYGLEDGDVPLPTQEEVEGAAKLANAHDFIMAMPDGYDTECGEKGVQLSGGQKQRIAIARALVRKPRILLLDEATSALDADSEAVVQEAIDRIMRERTVLVVAHRLSTVQNAHRIVVISKGQVQEEGVHAELYARGGIYYNLVRRQLQMDKSSNASLTSLDAPPPPAVAPAPAPASSRVAKHAESAGAGEGEGQHTEHTHGDMDAEGDASPPHTDTLGVPLSAE